MAALEEALALLAAFGAGWFACRAWWNSTIEGTDRPVERPTTPPRPAMRFDRG